MIVKTVDLRCDPDAAFRLFTERAGEWWPNERRHTEDSASIIRIEETGRFYERAGDGTEVELGVVRVFERGSRLLLDWYPGTGREEPTRVEVRFEKIDAGTRVTILHDAGAAPTETFNRNAARYDRAWDSVLVSMRDV